MSAPRTKMGDQEVWRWSETHWSHLEQSGDGQNVPRRSGTQWSHLEQRRAARRCGEGLGLSGRTLNKEGRPGGVERVWDSVVAP